MMIGRRWLAASALLALTLTYVVVHPESATMSRQLGWTPRMVLPFAENPLRMLVRVAADDAPIRARVVQRLPAGPYTYLGLRTDGDASLLWAVTLGRGEPLHAHVRLRSMGHARDFHSRRIDRTFPELVFGIVARIE